LATWNWWCLAGLPRDEYERLLPSFELVRFPKDRILYESEDRKGLEAAACEGYRIIKESIARLLDALAPQSGRTVFSLQLAFILPMRAAVTTPPP
jgi:hypothetical protein